MQSKERKNEKTDTEAMNKTITTLTSESILAAEQFILVQPVSNSSIEEGACGQPDEVDMSPDTPSAHQASGAASAESTQSGGSLRTVDVSKVVRSLLNCTLGQSHLSQQDCTLQAPSKNTVLDEVQTESAIEDSAVVVGVLAAPFEVFSEPTETGVLACGAPLPPNDDAPEEGDNDENRLPGDCSPPEVSVKTKSLQHRVPFAELPMDEDEASEDEEDDIGVRPTDDDNFTYAPSKSFVLKVTSTPCATDRTVPKVGEDFTVGGLTALVQDVAISDPTDTAAPLGTRRFPVAAAVDLSTIYECSKEGKSSSNSEGSTCSSSSSSHLLAAGSTLSVDPARLQVLQPDSAQVAPSVLFRRNPTTMVVSPCRRRATNESCLETPAKRPVLKGDAQITLGDHEVKMLRHLASGAYARVYLAQMVKIEETYLDDDESFESPSQVKVVLKVDDNNGNACWESYICCELHRHLSETSGAFTKCVVDLQLACFFSNDAISVFPYSPHGTLLDLVTQFEKHCRSSVPECLVLYFALEFITILQQVHLCGIIHADIKPDNVLIIDLPSKAGFLDSFSPQGRLHIIILDSFSEQGPSCLQLIDFGRAIDMSQLPPGTAFSYVVTTEGFVCTEMRDNRQWTFQTDWDWFGLLGCLHVLLFGHYMEIEKRFDSIWGIRNKFKRYWQQDVWNRLFSNLLNNPSCSELPDLMPFVLEIKSLLRYKSCAHSVVVEALRTKNF
nr:LOW QUALITY PROTEIN: mitotic checkpoint serine/threonine-protein kinase bub-1-like [Rhipicephalus microplus]